MISITSLSLSYNGKRIFDNFSLSLKHNEKLVLNSPSGTGKTTLVKIIMGFENSYTGTVEIDSKTLTPASVKLLRNKIAYVSQDVDLPQLSVDAFLKEVFNLWYNKNLKFNIDSFNKYVKKFNLPLDIQQKDIPDLSGGERSRLGIITALLLDRPILILDEPTAALDSDMKSMVSKYILSLNKTVMIISHDEVWFENKNVRSISL
jgi:putative ABC transport system ATP-binding protein